MYLLQGLVLVAKIENPMFFKPLTGDLAQGIDTEVLIEVCDALIDAAVPVSGKRGSSAETKDFGPEWKRSGSEDAEASRGTARWKEKVFGLEPTA